MTDALRLPAPLVGAGLHAAVQALVNAGQLDAVLDLSVVEFDELAQRVGVEVLDVTVAAAAVAVHYRVRWTSFHACEDRTFGGANDRVLRGRVDDSSWLFPRLQPLPLPMDRYDEG